MSDGITDCENICPLCGKRMFGHNYIECHKASVICLVRMNERITEMQEQLEARLIPSNSMELKWQPIETAPKDDSSLLLWGSGWCEPEVGYFDSGYRRYCNSYCTPYLSQPTHWMHLPEPPKEVE